MDPGYELTITHVLPFPWTIYESKLIPQTRRTALICGLQERSKGGPSQASQLPYFRAGLLERVGFKSVSCDNLIQPY